MGWGGVGWGGDVNVRLKLNTPLMLRWAWGGVGMWTFVWSWARYWCYAEHGVGWGCERSFEVEHTTDATLSMGWGGDVNVRLKLNTPLMLRWAWGGVGWGGDVNVRLKLNTLLMLRWAWGGVGMLTYIVCSRYRFWGVYHNNGCHTSVDTVFDNGNDKVEYIRSWQWRWENALCPDLLKKKTAQVYMHNDHWNWQGKKKVRILCGRVAKRKKNDFKKKKKLWDGHETLKGLSFFDNGDAPTRAIPHPAGYIR